MNRWRFFNPNPLQKSVGDCSIRAVAVALGVDWETAYRMTTKAGYEMADMPSSNAVWGSVLREHGFKRYAVPNTCPDCYTAEDFAMDHPQGVYVLGFGNHVATLRNGIVMDSWNSLSESPQYFWYRED